MAGGIVWCPHCKAPHKLGTKVCPTTAKTLERGLNVQASAEDKHPLIGTIVGGKYRIDRLIGRGGVAEVFEAENTMLRRPVAVKVVRRTGSDHAALRLQREALLVAAIQHPNICDVYDAGALPNGAPFVVLERLSGETFGSHLKHAGRLSVAAAADVFMQILSGLQRAHGASIIHRDLKPQNVFFVDRLGCAPLVKLLDFGFAKDLSESVGRSITLPPRMLIGTPAYMAPEQLRGTTSPRSDLFSVGVMLYEALTGRHPFIAPTHEELEINVLRREPRAPRDVRSDLPPSVDALLARALAKEPAHRWPTALDFQQAVKSALLPSSTSRWGGSIPPESGPPSSSSSSASRSSDGSDGHIPVL